MPKKEVEPFHGLLADQSWAPPCQTLKANDLARPGYDSVVAHEYQDQPDVLRAKIKLMAQLIRSSRNCILYTGAGISTASGLADYASRNESSNAFVEDNDDLIFDAEPSLGHRVLAAMQKHGWIKWWCQQNHDGLPQKAGLPQHAINEIHGAWWDPSNPVVMFDEKLRTDLFHDLLKWEQRADLTIVVGTSLAGMNADRVVHTVSRKLVKQHVTDGKLSKQQVAKIPKKLLEASDEDEDEVSVHDHNGNPVLGSIIIGIQCTRLDPICSLKIFAKIDEVMLALAAELEGYSAARISADEDEAKVCSSSSAASAAASASAQSAAASAGFHFPKTLAEQRKLDYQPPQVGQVFPHGRLVKPHVFEFDLYDPATGMKRDASAADSTPAILNLSLRSKVVITQGMFQGCVGTVKKYLPGGHYRIDFKIPEEDDDGNFIEGSMIVDDFRLGGWMLDDALLGHSSRLLVLNATLPAASAATKKRKAAK